MRFNHVQINHLACRNFRSIKLCKEMIRLINHESLRNTTNEVYHIHLVELYVSYKERVVFAYRLLLLLVTRIVMSLYSHIYVTVLYIV